MDNGTTSIGVSEADILPLSSDDVEQAKKYLSLIVNARRGDPEALKSLPCAEQALDELKTFAVVCICGPQAGIQRCALVQQHVLLQEDYTVL